MNGKSVPLIDVFVHSLKRIREYALEGLRKNFSNPGRKIQWIITVPAIWTPAAKQFMRKAAVQVIVRTSILSFFGQINYKHVFFIGWI